MQRIGLVFCIAIMLLACNQTDKKAQLDKLRKDHDKITQEIQKLEKEIASTSKASTQRSMDVSCLTIQPLEFNHYIDVQGKIDGEDNIGVSAKTLGVITNIRVKEGDMVKKGQVLADIDAQVLKQSLEELKSSYLFIEDLYQKQKSLWDQKIGSEVQYLTAKNNKESMEKRIETFEEQIKMSSITSPIDGTIEEIPIKVGQSVAPGLPVFRVVNFSKVKVVAEVAENYSSKINSNDKVDIFIPDINKEISATVTFASKYINPINRTFTVQARIQAGEEGYRANMIAVLKINDYSAKDAFVVPVNVVQNAPEGQYIYVAINESGKTIARKKNVNTGITYNGLTEIKTGLASGDKVITTGYQELSDGQLIIVK